MGRETICILFIVGIIFGFSSAQFPVLTFEAFEPSGLRVSIPAEDGIELFAFHGKVNQPIRQIEPGDFSKDIRKPTGNRFVYLEPNLTLKEGDIINYWIFLQRDQFRFRKDDQTWTVDKLLPIEDLHRDPGLNGHSVTKIEGQTSVQSGEIIVKYSFSNKPIDNQLWTVEQYIPGAPDWLFNIYKSSPGIVDIENNVLRIKPELEEANVRKTINLNPGCTRNECTRNFISILNPPIASGQVVSKKVFCYGNVTLRAKLPIGDYLFSEIYLEDVAEPNHRILIAFARGNKDYISKNGVDDGGSKLYAGPYTSVIEPAKSKYLSTYQHIEHIGKSWHTFTLIWKPNEIDFYIDGRHFGHRTAEELEATNFNKDKMVRLVLGVGAGGPYEFPDGYTSSGQLKPYGSFHSKSIKEFLDAKASWYNTWTRESQLLVDFVSITAL